MKLPRLEDKPEGVNTFAWIIEVSQAYRREAIAEHIASTEVWRIRQQRTFRELREREAAEEARYTRRSPRFG